MALGPELIADSDDQNFTGGDIGNWVIDTDGTPSSTLAYEGTAPGAEKVGMLTFDDAGTATKLYALLPTTVRCPISPNTIVRVSADFYPEAANTIARVILGFGALTDDSGSTSPTLAKGEWTTVAAQTIIGTDITGNVRVGFTGTPTTGDILYFDNVSVKQILVGDSPIYFDEFGVDYVFSSTQLKVKKITITDGGGAAKKAVFIDNDSNVMAIVQTALDDTGTWEPKKAFNFPNGFIFDESASSLVAGDILMIYTE